MGRVVTFTYDGAPDVPSDPLEYTPDQRRAVVEWFASLPLAELRQRQSIKSEEIGRGHDMNVKGQIPERVVERIIEEWEQLTDAVSLQAFGVTMYGSHDAQQPAKS